MESAVVVRGLVKYYGSFQALRGVSFEAPIRGVTVVLGPNGAGKTTTLRAVSGALRISRGYVEVLGHDVARDPLGAKMLMGVVPEAPYLFPGLSVEDNLKLAGRLHGLGGEELRRRVGEVAEELGLSRYLSWRYGRLSKGFKRRVDIAAALIHSPGLLVLDEPTGGLDLLAAVRLRDTIRGLSSRGVSILMSTHNVSEAAELADHVVVLVDGRVGFSGSPQRLREMLGGGVELIVVVDGEAARLAPYIRRGSLRAEGSVLRVRPRSLAEALRDILRGSEELGIGIKGLSVREASWEEVFLRFFREGLVPRGESEEPGGCVCEGA